MLSQKLSVVVLIAFLCVLFSRVGVRPVAAQAIFPLDATASATLSAEASASATPVVASRSSILIENSDITQTGEDTNTLLATFRSRPPAQLTPFTLMRYAIRVAVDRGIPINTIVFLFLFPMVFAVIAIARHIIGLTGFSVYAPAALALALLSLGFIPGTALFIAVLFFAAIAKRLLPILKLPYMPRTAMLLWFVSLGIFVTLALSTYVNAFSISTLNVFALLILILLSEDFMEIQSARTGFIAIQRAVETFVLGFLCAYIMGSLFVQALVLYYPELIILVIAVVNILVGKFVGLRLTEWLRFKPIMDTEE